MFPAFPKISEGFSCHGISLNASSHCYCVCNPLQTPGVFASYEFVCGSGWGAEVELMGRVDGRRRDRRSHVRLHNVMDCYKPVVDNSLQSFLCVFCHFTLL